MIEKRIKEIRIKAGMTQGELSNMLHLDKSAVCNYETGRRKLPISILKRYMEIFNVSMEYITGVDSLAVREDEENFERFCISNNEIEFLKKIRKNHLIYDTLIANPDRGIEYLKRKIG